MPTRSEAREALKRLESDADADILGRRAVAVLASVVRRALEASEESREHGHSPGLIWEPFDPEPEVKP